MILRSTLLFLSRRKGLRRWVENSGISRKFTRRFVAGETLEEGLRVCARLNAEKILVTLDHLGENVTAIEEVSATREAYLQALAEIERRGLQSTVSIKLTHFGLDFSEEVCRGHVRAVVAAASRAGTAVEVDMESHEYVDRTLALVKELHATYGCVRAVIQAYLRRSEDDIRDLCRLGIPIRLCKGAYREPSSIAFQSKREVGENYMRLAELLLADGVDPAIATHDERIITEVIGRVRRRGFPAYGLEFQMLYGIRKSLQRRLVRQGFRVRLYVPYGVAWYPYFMRRLAERPANLLFLAKNLVRR